jgi:hypothetical protein
MKIFKPDEHDLEIINSLKGNHSVVGFTNRFDENWIGDIRKIGKGMNKGKYKFLTLISIGEDLTLQDLGYNDGWSKKEKYIQTNIEFIMTTDQMIELRDLLNHKLKGISKSEEDIKEKKQ